MTSTSYPLAPAGDDGLRRDRWGRLLVVPPDGAEPVGYTRVTTVAKATDDGGGLAPWKATLACVGMMLRPGLRAQWEALVAECDGDPWYAGKTSKAACKRLVEQCAEAGGSTNRAEIGTALHAITAQLDAGRMPYAHLTPETERDVEAYVNALIAYGVTIAALPDGTPAVEVTVVLDDVHVGGTPDRLVYLPGYDLPVVADLKTGADLSYSWQSFCVQLAGYSRANAIYRQGAAPDGSADERLAMPEVEQSVGLVIWLPAGTGRCELHVVDLDAGAVGFGASLWVRDWRQRRDLAWPYSAPVAPPALALVPEQPADPSPAKCESDSHLAGETPAPADDLTQRLRVWLQARIDVCGTHSDASRSDLMRSWPADLPTLGASTAHTPAQLAAVEALLDDVEARHSIAFGPSKPGTEHHTSADAIERLLHVFPNSHRSH